MNYFQILSRPLISFLFWAFFVSFTGFYFLNVYVVNPKVKGIPKVTSSHTRVMLIYIIWSGKDPQRESVSINSLKVHNVMN